MDNGKARQQKQHGAAPAVRRNTPSTRGIEVIDHGYAEVIVYDVPVFPDNRSDVYSQPGLWTVAL